MKKIIQWAKYVSYLCVAVIILGGWSYGNYINYEDVQQQIAVKVQDNTVLIDDAVANIEKEQRQLEFVQEVYEPALTMSMEAPSSPSGAHIKSMSRSPASVVDVLQDRIDALEAEKLAYVYDKKNLVDEIEDVISLFNIDIKNPLINFVIVPFFGYAGKRGIKMIFDALEEKLLDHEETK